MQHFKNSGTMRLVRHYSSDIQTVLNVLQSSTVVIILNLKVTETVIDGYIYIFIRVAD